MAVAFDAHIQYFAYNNLEGDDFAVGYLSTKEDWIERVNAWNRNDGAENRYSAEDWEELDQEQDLRGVCLAEVEPVDAGWFVTWVNDNGDENVVEITHKYEVSWKINPNKSDSIPQWLKRLKNTIREQKKQ